MCLSMLFEEWPKLLNHYIEKVEYRSQWQKVSMKLYYILLSHSNN